LSGAKLSAGPECPAYGAVAVRAPFPDLALTCLDAARRHWSRITSRAEARAFKSALRERGWAQGKSERALLTILSAGGVVRKRLRLPDAARAARDQRMADYLLTRLAPAETHGISGGQAFDRRCWGPQRAAIEGLLRSPAERARIAAVWHGETAGEPQINADERRCGTGADPIGVHPRSSAVPSLDMLDRVFRAHHGVASRLAVASDHARHVLSATIGFRFQHARQGLMCDATRLPVKVARGWGRAQKNGLAHWLHVLTDAESLYTRLYVHAERSETAAWDRVLERWLVELGYAPVLLYSDETSSLAADLRRQVPGEPCTLGPGLRLWLAAGVELLAHTAGRPGAKGAVESGGVKAAKTELKKLMIARAAERDLPMDRYREFENQGEWDALCRDWQPALNARRLRETNLTRESAWNEPDSVAWSESRALDRTALATRRQITDAVQVGMMSGRSCRFKRPGERTHGAELLDPDGRLPGNPDGATVIIAPAGLRMGDDPDVHRVVVLTQSPEPGGRLRPFFLQARAVRETIFGRPEFKPLYGEHPVGKHLTLDEARQAAWQRAALREGTNDEPVGARASAPARSAGVSPAVVVYGREIAAAAGAE
jgi:hypothetical protein